MTLFGTSNKHTSEQANGYPTDPNYDATTAGSHGIGHHNGAGLTGSHNNTTGHHQPGYPADQTTGLTGTHHNNGITGNHHNGGLTGTHNNGGLTGTHNNGGLTGTHNNGGLTGTHHNTAGTHGVGHHHQPGVLSSNPPTAYPAGAQSEYPTALSGTTDTSHVPFHAEQQNANNFATHNTAHATQQHGHTATGKTPSTGGKALVGKIEHAVGTLVGSTALKEKGIMKEQEAAAIKAQHAETVRAEALEAEALNARQRAAGHGAMADIGKQVPTAPAGAFSGTGNVMPPGPNLGGAGVL